MILTSAYPPPEQAAILREDFEEVVARVNGDLFGQTIDCRDPFSIERAVMQAEQAVDYHLKAFEENTALQQLAPLIKKSFCRWHSRPGESRTAAETMIHAGVPRERQRRLAKSDFDMVICHSNVGRRPRPWHRKWCKHG